MCVPPSLKRNEYLCGYQEVIFCVLFIQIQPEFSRKLEIHKIFKFNYVCNSKISQIQNNISNLDADYNFNLLPTLLNACS